MIKSGESLEWVIDSLMNGKKIKNINQEIQQEAEYLSKFRGSLTPTGSRKNLTPSRSSNTRRATGRSPKPNFSKAIGANTTISDQLVSQV